MLQVVWQGILRAYRDGKYCFEVMHEVHFQQRSPGYFKYLCWNMSLNVRDQRQAYQQEYDFHCCCVVENAVLHLKFGILLKFLLLELQKTRLEKLPLLP